MFNDSDLHPSLIKALQKADIHQPTEVQAATLPAALSGKDLLVSAVTGSGKTLAFLLPILQRCLEQPAPQSGTRALILTPTRELAEQVCKACIKAAAFTPIKALSVCGGEGFREQAAKIRKNPEIIVGTPGRLVEHLERGSIDFKDLEVLVLDEADRMLDMGMRDEVLKIAEQCRPERQTLLFSATLNHKEMGHITRQVLREPEQLLLSTAQTAVETITRQIILADDNKLKERQLTHLLKHEPHTLALVFTNTRTQADHLGGYLRYQGIRAAVLHGEMEQDRRRQVMRLLREKRIDVLVATDVAARGLDVDGIDLVINFEMARSGDEYVHRIGRTGRAGQSGLAISLIAPSEWNLMSSIERYLKIHFERRTLAGLEGSYKGPKKLKASGKAAGSRDKKERKRDDTPQTKVKKRLRDQKNIGKRRRPSTEKEQPTVIDQGFAPLKRRQD